MMCVLSMNSTPTLILQHGRFGTNKLGNHLCMVAYNCQRKPGLGGSGRGAATPLVRPHPGGAAP
jgi:hypothetical protein